MLMYIIIIVVLVAVIILSIKNLLDLNKKDDVVVNEPVKEQRQEESKRIEAKTEQHPRKKKPNNSEFISFAIFGFTGSIISIGFGFYKMLVYDEYERNSYVGGDAYNLIINANYSTAFFVLGLILMIFACSMLIMNEIQKLNR